VPLAGSNLSDKHLISKGKSNPPKPRYVIVTSKSQKGVRQSHPLSGCLILSQSIALTLLIRGHFTSFTATEYSLTSPLISM